MIPVKRLLRQSLFIVTLAFALAFAVNAIRPDGLPLFQPEASAIAAATADGEVSIQDAALLYASGRAVFVDARMDIEYSEGHIAGALNLPTDSFDYIYPDLAEELQKKESIVTYCDGEMCELSHRLADELRAKGLKNVYVLRNGWSLWQLEKLPVKQGMEP